MGIDLGLIKEFLDMISVKKMINCTSSKLKSSLVNDTVKKTKSQVTEKIFIDKSHNQQWIFI